jgi:hypothetical protein
MSDQTTRSCIHEEPTNLGACITRIDGNCDDPQQAAGIDEFDVVGPIWHQESQTISTQQAATPQRRSDPSHSGVQFKKGYGLAASQQSCVLREVLQGATNGMGVNHRSL